MSSIFNGINEAARSPEPDYTDPSWDEKVSNVGQKAKQAEVLKSKGKEPKTRWNPETKKYYVDFSDVDESVGLPYPGTYEETNDMFKGSGQRRIGTLTTEEGVEGGSKEIPQWKKDWYAKQKPNSWPKHPQPYHNPNWIAELSPEQLKKIAGQKSVAEGDDPFRGTGGAFNRGDDERHDLDPTDWYIVKDGKMFAASIYPRQVQQAIAQGFSRTKQEARAKASSEGVAEAEEQGIDNKYRRVAKEMINVYNTNPEIKAKVDASTDPLEAMVYTTGVIKNPDRLTGTTHMNKLMTELESIYYYGREQSVAEGRDGDTNFGHTVTRGSWVVHDGNKVKRFNTHNGAKAYAEKNGGKVASSEFYADKIQGKQGVAEGSGKNVVKSIKVGNFRHDLVDTGMGWQVRIYNGDELYDTGLSKNSEQKGLAALEDAVAYTEKQTRTKRQGVAEEKQRLDPKCWTGKHKEGTKMKGGVRVNNCVPNESSIMKGIKV